MGDVLGRKGDAFVQFKQQLLNNDSINERKEQPETNQQQQEQIKRKHGDLNKLYNRIVPATRFSHD